MADNQDKDLFTKGDDYIRAWLISPERSRKGPASWGVRGLQVLYTALHASLADRLPFLANGLTFITLLGLVPALAISFSVAKGLGFSGALRALIIENELLAGQKEVMVQVLSYVDRTQVSTLGILGLLALVATLILTLSSVEETVNRIWEVKNTRSWLRKATDYFSVMIICPLLVVGAFAAWAHVSNNQMVQWLMGVAVVGEVTTWGTKLWPIVMLSAAFSFVYLFLPNTRVPVSSAAIAGVIAGLLWWAVQSIYISFQVGVAKYNAIYGGFASLPLFMVWLQVSWQVVLFGAELAHAHYVVRQGQMLHEMQPALSVAQMEELAMRMMYRLALHFHRGEEPCTIKQLARSLGVTQTQTQEAANLMCRARLVVEAGSGHNELHPARSLDTLTLAHVWKALRGPDAKPPRELAQGLDADLIKRLHEVHGRTQKDLAEVTLLDLVRNSPAIWCEPPQE